MLKTKTFSTSACSWW